MKTINAGCNIRHKSTMTKLFTGIGIATWPKRIHLMKLDFLGTWSFHVLASQLNKINCSLQFIELIKHPSFAENSVGLDGCHAMVSSAHTRMTHRMQINGEEYVWSHSSTSFVCGTIIIIVSASTAAGTLFNWWQVVALVVTYAQPPFNAYRRKSDSELWRMTENLLLSEKNVKCGGALCRLQ